MWSHDLHRGRNSPRRLIAESLETRRLLAFQVSGPLPATTTQDATVIELADTGGPYVIDEGQSLTLDASASTGDPTRFTWDIIRVPDDDMHSAFGVNPTLTWQELNLLVPPVVDDGVYNITLLADGFPSGFEQIVHTTLTVENVAPTISYIEAPSVIPTGGIVPYRVMATDPANGETTIEIDGDLATYPVHFFATDQDGRHLRVLGTITANMVTDTIIGSELTFSRSPRFSAPLNSLPSTTGSDAGYRWEASRSRLLFIRQSDEDGCVSWDAEDGIASMAFCATRRHQLNFFGNGGFGSLERSAGLVTRFRVNAVPPDPLFYRWDFGDGTPEKLGETQSHIYAAAGNYTITVTVIDDDGGTVQQSLAVQVTDIFPPEAVPVVTASQASSPDYIKLSWQAAFGAETYNVYRSLTPNPGDAILLVDNLADLEFHDVSADAAVRYYYWVQAENSEGIGPFSSSATGSKQLATPTGLTASDGTSTDGVALMWDSVVAASRYDIYRATSNDLAVAQKIAANVTGTTYVDRSAQFGQRYFYWVEAASELGNSEPSDSDVGFRETLVPNGISASDGLHHDRVVVTWGPLSTSTSYSVYRSESRDGSCSERDILVGTDISTDAILSISPITGRSWESLSISDDIPNLTQITGAAFDVSSSTLYLHDTGRIISVDLTSGVAQLIGTMNVPAPFGGSELAFDPGSNVLYATHMGSLYRVDPTDASATLIGPLSDQIIGMTYDEDRHLIWGATNRTHQLMVIDPSTGNMFPFGDLGLDEGGGLAYDNNDNVLYLAHFPSQKLYVVDIATGRARLAGSMASDGAIRGNALAYIPDPDLGVVGADRIVDNLHESMWVDTDVIPGDVYCYAVRAKDAIGQSKVSISDAGYAAEVVLPTPTAVMASDGLYTNRIDVTWSAVPGAERYDVWRGISSNPTQATLIATEITETSFSSEVDSGIYYFFVRARNSAGVSTFSVPDVGSVLVDAPGLPGNVLATDGSFTDRVSVTWDAAIRSDTYEVWRGTSDDIASAQQITTTSETRFDDASVMLGETLYYWVRGVNQLGPGSFSLPDSGFRASQTILVDSGQAMGTNKTNDVLVGDLDGDGDLDYYEANDAGQGDRVWRNNGDGTFSDTGQSLGTDSSLFGDIGDIDNDGDLDVVVSNGVSALVWRNNGTGIFIDSQQRLTAVVPIDPALGDLDGDGDLDLFISSGASAQGDGDSVWFNDGTGTFFDSGQRLEGSDSRTVELSDVDSDGDLDAIVANLQGDLANRVWFNNGQGLFVDRGIRLGQSHTQSIAVGDLNGDKIVDLFEVNVQGEPNRVYIGNGDGSFTESDQRLGHRTSTNVDLGDVDGDGDLDAIVANVGAVNLLYLNDGTGEFMAAQSIDDDTGQRVVFADLNRDGGLDLLGGNYGGPNRVYESVRPSPTVVSLQRNDENELFHTLTSLTFTFSEDVSATVDVADLVLFNTRTNLPVDTFSATVATTGVPNQVRFDLTGLAFDYGLYFVSLRSSGITDTSGMSLDGNRDGVAGDDYQTTLRIAELGDITLDGIIDASDAVQLLDNWGATGRTWTSGDHNFDGIVDAADAALFFANWTGDGVPGERWEELLDKLLEDMFYL